MLEPTTGARADLLAPGPPAARRRHGRDDRPLARTLDRGTVLVSPDRREPHLLVGVIEEIADATGAAVARRFGYAYVDEHGTVEAGRAGALPRLRRRPD